MLIDLRSPKKKTFKIYEENSIISSCPYRFTIMGDVEEKAITDFHIDKPKGWVANPNQKLKDNIERLDMNEARRKEILETHEGMIILCAYTKYDPKSHAGLMPTIQVNMAKNTTKDYANFKSDMLESSKQMQNMFHGFKFLDGPKDIKVDGHKAFFFQSEFNLGFDDSGPSKVRSWTDAIYADGYFYQINFSDMEEDDCSELFKKVLASIRV
ncbi:MAG: hypothetical protein HRT57_08755 [Crocinitomicaceae bacterium]|nr:hypothetical protein [Crocinitomicaceae bacterium]